jgi:hypothetical protein
VAEGIMVTLALMQGRISSTFAFALARLFGSELNSEACRDSSDEGKGRPLKKLRLSNGTCHSEQRVPFLYPQEIGRARLKLESKCLVPFRAVIGCAARYSFISG